MKKFTTVLAVATLTVSAPVFAETSTITTADVAIPTTTEVVITAEAPTQDLSFAFSNVDNLQAVAMTDEQMADTQGAWLPYVGVGAIGGYFGYMGYASAVPKEQRTFGGYATAIGSGAVGGALSITPIGRVRAAFVGGTVGFVGNKAATKNKK